MSKDHFEESLRTGQPYFGPYLACRRSWPQVYEAQQRLVKKLASLRRSGPIEILEVGAWAGASAASWGFALQSHFGGRGRIVSVDIWTSEGEPSIRSVFQHNVRASGIEHMVEPLQMTSDDAFRALSDRRFDIVYIDGDHSYPQVQADIAGAQRLLKADGVICGDDLEAQASDIAPRVLRIATAFNDAWAVDPDSGAGFHPGVTRAVAEAFGRVSAWHGFWAALRSDSVWSPISLDDVEAPIPPALTEYDDTGQLRG